MRVIMMMMMMIMMMMMGRRMMMKLSFFPCIHQDSNTKHCSDMIMSFHEPGPAPWLRGTLVAQVYFDMLEADPVLPPGFGVSGSQNMLQWLHCLVTTKPHCLFSGTCQQTIIFLCVTLW